MKKMIIGTVTGGIAFFLYTTVAFVEPFVSAVRTALAGAVRVQS